MRIIDLRSDTITKPSDGMRKAMASAEVGDDVFGDDPSVNELEVYVAEMLGKEAAIFMPSGTMANQVALRAHTNHGDEILIDANAHIYWYEAGAPAALSGITCKQLPGIRGIFKEEDVRAAIRPGDNHFPPTRLLTVENTHNRGGGSVWPIDSIRQVTGAARELGLKTHLDGARLWNASAATGISESEYSRYFDSVSVCFSKGLGAPVGSALAGNSDYIEKCRRFRKQFGGGMRQAGIIAAAAIYAIKNNRKRLTDDHDNAKKLAEGLHVIPGIKIDPDDVSTNMVYFDVEKFPAEELVHQLKFKGVRVIAVSNTRIRAATSLMISSRDIELTLKYISRIMRSY